MERKGKAMRWFYCGLCLTLLGCGESPQGNPSESAAGLGQTSPTPLGGVTAATDWPGFLGPLGTSVSPEKGILSPWPENGLRVVWQKRVGMGYGMPSISQGRLFLFDRQGDQARLTCLRPDSGDFLWKFEYPSDYEDFYGYDSGPRCCPVVDGDRVYIFGAEGMLHCVRSTDGKPLWKVDTRAEFNVAQNFFGVGSAPVVEGDLLIVQVGGSVKNPDADAPLKGNGSGVVAFDKITGTVKYKITDELASYASPVLATIQGRRWCFVLARGGLIGFEPATGKVDFHFPWRARAYESVNASNPVVAGDRVFISETYGPGSALLQVKPGGYEVLWSDEDKRSDKSMQCHWNTPIFCDGYLYGCSGRHPEQAELRCIELATGKIMWSEPDLTRTSLLMVDGHFLCLGEYGQLRLLKVNPKRYEEVSRMELYRRGDPDSLLMPHTWAAPILSHGLLYLRGRNQLVCLELVPKSR
jgi:outer membrane protein assembly factor BamB